MFVVAPVRQSAVFDECVGQEFAALQNRPKDTVNEQENVLFSFSHTHNQRDFLKVKYYSELQNVKKITFLNIFFLMNIIILE